MQTYICIHIHILMHMYAVPRRRGAADGEGAEGRQTNTYIQLFAWIEP